MNQDSDTPNQDSDTQDEPDAGNYGAFWPWRLDVGSGWWW